MYEWLYEVRAKARLPEYIIVWVTFVIIHVVGVNAGIGTGAILSFAERRLNHHGGA